MRIYEIVSNQNIANEQILTEIDWKKLRNALIGGAMSLAVLGAPGKAIAQSLDTNKITPDQAIELIQKKLASGEIRPDQLQNLNKSADIKKTEPNKTVQPTVKQDEPKKTDVVANKDLSDFSIKGLKFGMSVADVRALTGKYVKPLSPGLDAYDNKQWGNGAFDQKNPLTNFSIGGYSGWEPNGNIARHHPTLMELERFVHPDDFNDVAKQFTQQYGESKISKQTLSTQMGYKVNNITMIWKVKDATIELNKYDDIKGGSLRITSNDFVQKKIAARNIEKQKASKDF